MREAGLPEPAVALLFPLLLLLLSRRRPLGGGRRGRGRFQTVGGFSAYDLRYPRPVLGGHLLRRQPPAPSHAPPLFARSAAAFAGGLRAIAVGRRVGEWRGVGLRIPGCLLHASINSPATAFGSVSI